jgi:ankyrin repeat protein
MAKEDRQRIEAIKAAVEADPGRVDAPDEEGHPPLHRAVIDRYSSLLGWLLDRGADPNVRNARGETTLHVAAIFDRTPDRHILRTLIRRGADPNARREDGTAPLHVAAGYGDLATLEALLEGGADPRARSSRGDTPLHLAATPQPTRTPEDCRLFVQRLVARGADPEHRDRSGRTALEAALARPAMRYQDGKSGPVDVAPAVELLRTAHRGRAR